MRSTGVKNLKTVMGISTVSLVISESPNVPVRSLKVPTTVNWRSVQLDHLPHGILYIAEELRSPAFR